MRAGCGGWEAAALVGGQMAEAEVEVCLTVADVSGIAGEGRWANRICPGLGLEYTGWTKPDGPKIPRAPISLDSPVFCKAAAMPPAGVFP